MAYEIPTRWPLVEMLSNREGDLFKDARLINCYAELNPQTKDYSVERRPCVLNGTVFNPPNGFPQGIFNFDGDLIQISGGKLYSQGNLLGTVGGVPGTQNMFTVAFTSQDADLMMVANEASGYFVDGGNSSLNQIVDPNYPNFTVAGVVYLNGRFYVMDTAGRIFGAKNLDDPTTWDPLNVIVAQQKSGRGVFLAEQLSYIVALKANSAEIFWDSGQTATQDGTGSTLQPIPGALVPYGCKDPGTVQLFDGTLIWMTTNESGSPQIGRMDNLQFQIVSTPSVDRLLKLVRPGSAFATTIKLGGHRFYSVQINQLNNTDPSFTLVYDLDQNLWYIWTDANFSSIPQMKAWPYMFSTAQSNVGTPTTYVQDSNGQLKQLTEDYVNPLDILSTVPVDIYTPNYDAGVDREKHLSALFFNSDIVQGSLVQVRYSDNDYGRWTNPMTVNLGYVKPRLNDLGSFQRRAFHLHHNCATPFRIKSMGMQMAIGTL